MTKIADTIVGSLMSGSSRRTLLMCGAAVAAAAVLCSAPLPADFIAEGFRHAMSFAGDMPTALAVREFFDGAMQWVSTTGLGLQVKADVISLDISHQVREAVNDMRVWLGPAADIAAASFSSTIEKSASFASWIGASATAKIAEGPGQIAADIVAGLAALAGAWEGLKVLRNAYEGIVSRWKKTFNAPATDAPVSDASQNIASNLALSGEHADGFLARGGICGPHGNPASSREIRVDIQVHYPESRDLENLVADAAAASDKIENEIFALTDPDRPRLSPAGTSGPTIRPSVYMSRADVERRKLQMSVLSETIRDVEPRRKRAVVDAASTPVPGFH